MGTRAIVWAPALAIVAALGAGVARPDLPIVGALGSRLAALAGADAGEGAPGAPALHTYYQFVDARGVVRFVGSLEEVPEAQRATAGRVELPGPPPTTPAEARAAALRVSGQGGDGAAGAPAKPIGPVTIYVTSWCPHCKDALADLDRRGIRYTKHDIDEDIDAKAALRAKTGATAVPVLEFQGRLLRGYSEDSYARAFDRAG